MKLKDNRGFTLVEIIITMAIVSIIVLVFYNILYTGFSARNISRERLEAMALSGSIVDEVKSTQSTWKNINGLKTWLVNEDNKFQELDSTFVKTVTDSDNIVYNAKILINKTTEIEGLFQLEITIDSPNVNNVRIITRLREDD